MEFADGIAVGVALCGLVYGVASYARQKERDSLVMAAVSGAVGIVATVAAFAPDEARPLTPVIWAAATVGALVVRRERNRQH